MTILLGRRRFAAALLALAAVSGTSPFLATAKAEDTIKIGLLAPFSGPFATYGPQFLGGMKTYLAQHGDTVAGKKVEIIIKDTTGPAPELGQRLAQELILREKVDFLAVGGFTPETLTAGSIASRAKIPLLVLNASSTGLTQKIPYGVRVAFTFNQITKPSGTWMAKEGYKKVVSLVPDYGPGHDVEEAFKKSYSAGNGKIIDSIRVPLKSPEFAPFIQRIKDLKPDALFAWVPAGEMSVALLKAFYGRGLDEAGIKLVVLGDMLDEDTFGDLGKTLKGVPSSLHYSLAHESSMNTKFIKDFAKSSGIKPKPTFMAVAAYDGAALIYKAIKAQKGKLNGRASLAAMSGLEMESPRGKIKIDSKSRDITQTIYMRKVAEKGGELVNEETQAFENEKP